MKEVKGRVMMVAWSVAIQLWIRKSLILGMMNGTCLSVGTDFTSKKLWQAFLNSIMMLGMTSPPVKTGAFLLVDSMVAMVDIFDGVNLHWKSWRKDGMTFSELGETGKLLDAYYKDG